MVTFLFTILCLYRHRPASGHFAGHDIAHLNPAGLGCLARRNGLSGRFPTLDSLYGRVTLVAHTSAHSTLGSHRPALTATVGLGHQFRHDVVAEVLQNLGIRWNLV